MSEYRPLEGQLHLPFEPDDITFLDDDGTPLPTLRESLKWHRDDHQAAVAVASGLAMRLEDKPAGGLPKAG
jgi:hypothetical protein